MQLYGRALHPELFEVFAQKRLERGKVAPAPRSIAATDGVIAEIDADADGYEARIAITSAGHVVHWRHRGLTLTEVCASSHQPLPQRRRLMSHRLEGEQSDRVECRGGVVYETSLALETASPEALSAYRREFDLMSLQGSALPLGEGGDSSGLQRDFELALQGDAQNWQLTLTPRALLLKQIFNSIRIDGGALVQRIVLDETQGDRPELLLQNSVAADALSDREQHDITD